jgi:hypothetical protein
MRRLLVLALALVVTPAATAATLTLSITTGSPVSAPSATLSGVDQTKTFPIVVSEVYTGAGNTLGWKITASSTTLTSSGRTLPPLQVTAIALGTCTGTCVTPSNSITLPVALSTTAQSIYNAAANTGKGTWPITGTFQITYPANALPGAYSAVVTLATASGPT